PGPLGGGSGGGARWRAEPRPRCGGGPPVLAGIVAEPERGLVARCVRADVRGVAALDVHAAVVIDDRPREIVAVRARVVGEAVLVVAERGVRRQVAIAGGEGV